MHYTYLNAAFLPSDILWNYLNSLAVFFPSVPLASLWGGLPLLTCTGTFILNLNCPLTWFDHSTFYIRNDIVWQTLLPCVLKSSLKSSFIEMSSTSTILSSRKSKWDGENAAVTIYIIRSKQKFVHKSLVSTNVRSLGGKETYFWIMKYPHLVRNPNFERTKWEKSPSPWKLYFPSHSVFKGNRC